MLPAIIRHLLLNFKKKKGFSPIKASYTPETTIQHQATRNPQPVTRNLVLAQPASSINSPFTTHHLPITIYQSPNQNLRLIFNQKRRGVRAKIRKSKIFLISFHISIYKFTPSQKYYFFQSNAQPPPTLKANGRQ